MFLQSFWAFSRCVLIGAKPVELQSEAKAKYKNNMDEMWHTYISLVSFCTEATYSQLIV